MTCKNCGEEIKDDSIYCPHCGADVVEVVVLSAESVEMGTAYERKEKLKALDAQRNLAKKQQAERLMTLRKKWESRKPFYESNYAYFICELTAFFSCFLILLVPFLRWIRLHIRNMSDTLNTGVRMLDFIKQKNLPVILLTLMLLASGSIMLYFALKDYCKNRKIPEFDFIRKWELWIRILPIVLGILVMLIFPHTKLYKVEYENYKALHDSYRSQIYILSQSYGKVSHMYSRMGRGMGFVCAVAGIILYIFSNCFKFVLDTLHEDDEPEAANASGHEQEPVQDENLEPELTATSMEETGTDGGEEQETEAELEKEQETKADSGEETDADRKEEIVEENPEA